MQTYTLEEAQGRLAEIIENLLPGEEVIITTCNDLPVARIVAEPGLKRFPLPGRGKGMLTILSEDDDHLQDWGAYSP
jgi:antitoxin (DNA-binding transcriptional repressor) of toxin-antitoxin stability system